MPLHPFLLCLYLVLRLVAGNLDEASVQDAWRAMLVLVVATGLFLLLLRFVVGGSRPAALVATLILALGFSFQALLGQLPQSQDESSGALWFYGLLTLEALVVLGVVWWFRRIGERLTEPTRVVNVVAAALLLFAMGELLWFGWQSRSTASSLEEERIIGAGQAETVRLQAANEPLRDIYLIVLDAYTRGDVLRDVYAHDNSGFLGELERQGFQVADSSFSNYLSTRLTLPSLLNMHYLDHLTRQYGRNYPNVQPLVREIQSNRVVSSLREAGYRIVNIQSQVGYAGLANADEVIVWDASWWQFNALETVLVDMTPLQRWRHAWSWTEAASPESQQRQQVLFNLEQLGKQGRTAGPKFVLAHIMSPHQPFVFGRKGEEQLLDFTMQLFHEHSEEQRQALHRAYADQVSYLNTQVLVAIRSILTDSPVSPIIVLMGDHGLRLYMRRRPNDTCLRESFAILFAMHLPGVDAAVRRRTSPVNTFRTIFDAYFDAGLGTLPEQAFFSHRFTGYYSYRDVTSAVETCNGGP